MAKEGRETPASSDRLDKDRFDRLETLGKGGMGIVYRVYDKVRRQEVASKTLLHLDGSSLFRFKKEFRSLAGIVHPNLVTLYELHNDSNGWFFTMELINGVSFLEYVRPHSQLLAKAKRQDKHLDIDQDGDTDADLTPSLIEYRQVENIPSARRKLIIDAKFYPDRLQKTLIQVVTGIQALHQAQKLHCDIKPSNILVNKKGRAVVCDFGLVADTAYEPHKKGVFGTPMYMSPEQAGGGQLTPASDWYSLGVVLYEAMTGRVPFEGPTTADTLRQKISQPLIPPIDLEDIEDPVLNDLCVRLLAVDPQDRPPGEEILTILGQTGNTKPLPALVSHQQEFPLVGRKEHLDILRNSLTTSRKGNCVAVFVQGLSGMGKSALIENFLNRVRPHSVVLEGCCHFRESVPYKALDTIVDALSSYLLSLPANEIKSLIPQDINSLARLFPVLQRVEAVKEMLQSSDELPRDLQELRTVALGALRVLLTKIAEQKQLILYIDDLQWGDLDSAPFLTELIHHPLAPKLLFLGAYRSDEAEDSPLLASLLDPDTMRNSYGDLRFLSVEALNNEHAQELAVSMLGGPEAPLHDHAEQIVAEAGGNPLFIAELSKYVLDSGKEVSTQGLTLDGVIGNRIECLPTDHKKLLTTMAVAGRPVSIWVLARAARIQGEADILVKLQAENLVRSRQGELAEEVETYHDRIRATIVGKLSKEQLSQTHHSLALAFEEAEIIDAPAMVEHWLGAGKSEPAVKYALLAAAESERIVTFHLAAHYYELVLRLAKLDDQKRRELQIKLAIVLENGGSLEKAADIYIGAAEGDDSPAGTDLRRRAVESLLRSRKLERGLALAKSVLKEVGLKLPRSGFSAIVTLLMHRLWFAIRGLEFKEKPKDKIDPMDLLRLDVCYALASGLSAVDPIYGIVTQMTQLRLALKTGEPLRASMAMIVEVAFRSFAGHKARASVRRHGDMLQKLADSQGQGPAGCALIIRGLAAFIGGDFKLAFELCSQGEEMVRIEEGFFWEKDFATLYRTAAMVYLGKFGDLSMQVPLAVTEAMARGNTYLSSSLRVWRNNIAWLVLDDPDEMRRQIKRGEAQQGIEYHKFLLSPHFYLMSGYAQLALYQGDVFGAWKNLNADWPRFKKSGLKRIETINLESLHLRARCALAAASSTQERSEFLAIAQRCARKIEKINAPWGNALARIDRATLAALRGDTTTAVELMEKAIVECEASHMAMYAAAARRRCGMLMGGDRGAELVKEATDWMKKEKIKNPQRLANTFVPGFSD